MYTFEVFKCIRKWAQNIYCLFFIVLWFSRSNSAFTRWKIFAGVSIAPSPVSPHISFFAMHSISMWPQLLSTLMCWLVIGCSHMRVFMAGQKNNGLSKFHARVVHNSRLSHIPPAILANVFASNGAISITSAHLHKSMCRTGSSRFCHKFHSSASVNTVTSVGNAFRSRKCNALFVQITLIWNISWIQMDCRTKWFMWDLSEPNCVLCLPRM